MGEKGVPMKSGAQDMTREILEDVTREILDRMCREAADQWLGEESRFHREAALQLRRVGNLCLAARAQGWRARVGTRTSGYRMEWMGPGGERVDGPWASEEASAVVQGMEAPMKSGLV